MPHPNIQFDYFGDDAASPPTMDQRLEQHPTLPGLAEAASETSAAGTFEQHWLHTLAHVLTDEIQELCSLEKMLAASLGNIGRAATDKIFRAVCEIQAEQSREQFQRLEQVQQSLGQQPDGRACPTMEGLLMGLQETIAENEAGPVRDERLVEIARKIKQYEVAGYCSARDFAQLLGLMPVAELLQKSLDEKTAMEARLGNIAELFGARIKMPKV